MQASFGSHASGMGACQSAPMKNQLHIELVTETYPPEVNGVALTVQSLEEGLRNLGHRVAVVRTERPEENSRPDNDRVLIAGAPLPSYPGLRFGLQIGRASCRERV